MKDILPLTRETIAREFPVTRGWIYYNHAAVSPLPFRTANAMSSLIASVSKHGGARYEGWYETYEEARGMAARLIGADSREIAFTSNTSEGINIIAKGLPWKAGDNLIVPSNEFPANLVPWEALKEKGVEIRRVSPREGRILLEDVEVLVDEKTRLLTLSFVNFETGFRFDLEEVGRFCRERSLLFFVDAIQGLGAFPLDVRRTGIHFLSADGHKWLLGPEGCALFFCSSQLLESVHPPYVGWMSLENFNEFPRTDFSLWPSARRFEYGTPNTAGIYGLRASLELLLEAGIEEISSRILSVAGFLASGLEERGWTILSPRGEGECSGILTALPPGKNAARLPSRLQEKGVISCARGGGLRLSPHFYNTIEEAKQFLEILDQLD